MKMTPILTACLGLAAIHVVAAPPSPLPPGTKIRVASPNPTYMGRATNSLDDVEFAMFLSVGQKASPEVIREILATAAEKGDPRARFRLSMNTVPGIPVDVLIKERSEIARKDGPAIQKMAQEGNAEAQYDLSLIYELGYAVKQDHKKSFEWGLKAASLEHPAALVHVSQMYAYGVGVPPDIHAARRMLMVLRKLEPAVADYNLREWREWVSPGPDALKNMRAAPLFQAIGMQRDDAVGMLARAGLIRDVKSCRIYEQRGIEKHRFYEDGLSLHVTRYGRVSGVEACCEGYNDFKAFRGKLPFGMSWDTRPEEAEKAIGPIIGEGKGRGYNDPAWGLVYGFDNVAFYAWFQDPKEAGAVAGPLRNVRAFERWAADYNAPAKPR